MVSIAEEKRRMKGSSILFYGILIWLGYDCIFNMRESITVPNFFLAIVASVSAAYTLYSKLRIEILTLLGKSGKAE